MRKLCTQNA